MLSFYFKNKWMFTMTCDMKTTNSFQIYASQQTQNKLCNISTFTLDVACQNEKWTFGWPHHLGFASWSMYVLWTDKWCYHFPNEEVVLVMCIRTKSIFVFSYIYRFVLKNLSGKELICKVNVHARKIF